MARACLRPLQVGSRLLPNRIFRPAHEVMLCRDGHVTDALIDYHSARAEGGAGLLILESTAVHPSTAYNPKVLSLWNDDFVPGLRRLADEIHRHGACVFTQLWHGGHHALPLDGGPPWSASAQPGPALGIAAEAMNEAMILEIVQAFGAAALRARDAGLDGVELHAAHGYLPRQFLAPATNDREDRWGGSFENRARFTLEVMREIRRSVGQDIVVGIRLGPEQLDGQSDMGEITALIQALDAEGLADFISLSPGDYITAPGLIAAGMEQPAGYQLPLYEQVIGKTRIPLFVTGRFRNLDEADAVVREGGFQMVGMVRAMIADPDLVRKEMAGEAERVRPCIACNQLCTAGIGSGNVKCVVNVAACREGEVRSALARPPRKSLSVAVIGGGVAGLEAGRLAAAKGHKVTLFEARPDLGGTVRAVALGAPRMLAFGDIVHWMEAEVRRAGVDIHASRYIDPDDIDAADFDHVIVATGAMPPEGLVQRWRPGILFEPAKVSRVVSGLDALSLRNEAIPGHSVVFDDVGHYEGIAISEKLIMAGSDVTFATPFPSFAPRAAATGRVAAAYARLHRTGRLHLRTHAVVADIDDDSITLFDERSDKAPRVVAAGLVVAINHLRPATEFVRNLRARGIPTTAIGDASSPRFVEGAIWGAYRAITGLAA